MRPTYFDELELGDATESEPVRVEADEIVAFARRFDPQPFHTDARAAQGSSFGGLVACSAHVFAIQSQLAHRDGRRLAVVAGLGADELRFVNPVRPGDELVLHARVVDKRVSRSRPDRGIVVQELRLLNQRSEEVMRMLGSVMVTRLPIDATAAP